MLQNFSAVTKMLMWHKIRGACPTPPEHWGKEMKEKIRKQDREGLLLKCRDKAPLIVRVEEGVGWRRLWSEVMEHKLSYRALARK